MFKKRPEALFLIGVVSLGVLAISCALLGGFQALACFFLTLLSFIVLTGIFFFCRMIAKIIKDYKEHLMDEKDRVVDILKG
jgi:uncharacterized membrane protein